MASSNIGVAMPSPAREPAPPPRHATNSSATGPHAPVAKRPLLALQGDPEDTEPDEEQYANEIHVTLWVHQSHMTMAAYYTESQLLEGYQCSPFSRSLLQSLLVAYKPICIYTNAGNANLAKDLASENAQDGSGRQSAVRVIPKMDLDARSGERVLQSSLPASSANQAALAALKHEDWRTVGVLGAMLRQCEKHRIGAELSLEQPSLRLSSLRLRAFPKIMFMDADCFSALAIFSRESHPSSFKAGGCKEGLSLFGMMNFTKDQVVLDQRHDIVSALASPAATDTLNMLRNQLRGVANLMPILRRMSVRTVEVCDGVVDAIQNIADAVTQLVDFQLSRDMGRTCVRSAVNASIDDMRLFINGMVCLDWPASKTQQHARFNVALCVFVCSERLNQVALTIRSELPSTIDRYSVEYIPMSHCIVMPSQMGFLLVTPQHAGELQAADDLEQKFEADGSVYYKTARMHALDQEFGDVECDLRDLENSLLLRLQQQIVQDADDLRRGLDFAAELDAHPLLAQLLPGQFLANGCSIEPSCQRVQVITGPNGSGKSVYLKQVALAVYMAHIGSLVPATRAKIPIVDRILTRVATRESLTSAASSFHLDVRQMAKALTLSTPQSLVVVDEFGKGTNPDDGAALAAAVLRAFVMRGPESPMVLFTTHYLDIVKRRLLPDSPLVALKCMRYILPRDAQHEDDIIPLFQVAEGVADSSNACAMVLAAGIDEPIVQRAKEVSSRCVYDFFKCN
ncbi:uncharacterized protein MONBRDRAFT_26766 [Monosiga brevicollis MX1]|uniref:DNA mismatch repair proteins mutS family domain-containing protein n=1 Tax=Monosiga brevicollis TaxID=81824 RepID=A9V3B2_MONBE|nr:uncharacterized protein MONBRDRAFT_26766 [Monosiga brevicollis MX1]EDQ88158.1 predicted protein [Monosiga brevicollis MX1]|eukprot:XP_001747234.1 hypothetical protein [Monosiga brevicollis MX1]